MRTEPAPLNPAPVSELHGVGPALQEKLHRIGIDTIPDLLFHLPTRYVDRTRVTPIGALRPHGNVVVEGVVRGASVVFGRRRSLMVKLQDESGTLTLRFYHFSRAQQEQFRAGRVLRCFGEVRPGRAGLEIYHPEYRFRDGGDSDALTDTHLTPIYPATEGLTQQRMRQLASAALKWLAHRNPPQLLPDTLLPDTLRSAPLGTVLEYLHRPPASAPVDALVAGEHPYQQLLVFEELLAHQLALQKLRASLRRQKAPRLKLKRGSLEQALLDALPFQLTAAQQRVIGEIDADLQQGVPMMRLLQGDVGSGKTVVAALAALRAIDSGYQVAIMAPTEILAEQHWNNLTGWLEPLGVRCVKLTGRTRGKAREAIAGLLAGGEVSVAIGTHALFQDDVSFRALGLVIIDEQHRFGVEQRLALQGKGQQASGVPHQLVMTATPIPRTLAMSYYSNLDVSVIDELPPGRKPVTTTLLADTRRSEVIDRLRDQCLGGAQAYWVCTLIDESDELEAQAAEATASELAMLLPELSIGLIHGRLKPADKSAVMDAFKGGEIDLLVATTVIEVGVDVPNASFMIIENPERLGLAQLHQLRGRVGRGNRESHCVLLYHAPLSNNSQQRLAAMRRTQSGFEIAEIDLRLRGPGELLGARQAGEMRFRLADLQRDAHLLAQARDAARKLSESSPASVQPLIDRWAPLGERYSQA